jgi:E1-E2 ATPase/Cation transporter/ATPase, N-terminus
MSTSETEMDIEDSPKASDSGSETDALPSAFRHLLQALSEQTGVDIEQQVVSPRNIDGKPNLHTASDVSILLNLRPEVALGHLRRDATSADVVTKETSTTLHDEDLRLAEEIAAYGTLSRRKDRISKEQEDHIIEDHKGIQPPTDFVFNSDGLSSAEAAMRLSRYGRNALPDPHDPQWRIFVRKLLAPTPMVLWLTIALELAIDNYYDMAFLLVIQMVNATIGFHETNQAGDAVAALKGALKPTATVKRDGTFQVLDATLIVPGDTVLLGSGSAVPADCRINASEIDVDQSTLTGESLPVRWDRQWCGGRLKRLSNLRAPIPSLARRQVCSMSLPNRVVWKRFYSRLCLCWWDSPCCSPVYTSPTLWWKMAFTMRSPLP